MESAFAIFDASSPTGLPPKTTTTTTSAAAPPNADAHKYAPNVCSDGSSINNADTLVATADLFTFLVMGGHRPEEALVKLTHVEQKHSAAEILARTAPTAGGKRYDLESLKNMSSVSLALFAWYPTLFAITETEKELENTATALEAVKDEQPGAEAKRMELRARHGMLYDKLKRLLKDNIPATDEVKKEITFDEKSAEEELTKSEDSLVKLKKDLVRLEDKNRVSANNEKITDLVAPVTALAQNRATLEAEVEVALEMATKLCSSSSSPTSPSTSNTASAAAVVSATTTASAAVASSSTAAAAATNIANDNSNAQAATSSSTTDRSLIVENNTNTTAAATTSSTNNNDNAAATSSTTSGATANTTASAENTTTSSPTAPTTSTTTTENKTNNNNSGTNSKTNSTPTSARGNNNTTATNATTTEQPKQQEQQQQQEEEKQQTSATPFTLNMPGLVTELHSTWETKILSWKSQLIECETAAAKFASDAAFQEMLDAEARAQLVDFTQLKANIAKCEALTPEINRHVADTQSSEGAFQAEFDVFDRERKRMLQWCRQQRTNLDAIVDPDELQEFCASLLANHSVMEQNVAGLLELAEPPKLLPRAEVQAALSELSEVWLHLHVSALERLQRELLEIHDTSRLEDEVRAFAAYSKKAKSFLEDFQKLLTAPADQHSRLLMQPMVSAVTELLQESGQHDELSGQLHEFVSIQEGLRENYVNFRRAVLGRVTFLAGSTPTVTASLRRRDEYTRRMNALSEWVQAKSRGEPWLSVRERLDRLQNMIDEEIDILKKEGEEPQLVNNNSMVLSSPTTATNANANANVAASSSPSRMTN